LAATAALALPIHSGTVPWRVTYENEPEGAAYVETVNPSLWVQVPGAKWIGSTPQDGDFTSPVAAPGTYVYSLNIGSMMSSGGVLSLSYAADDTISWTITNGSLSGDVVCSANCFSSIRTLNGSFSANSVLRATVQNSPSGLNPTGLAVAGQLMANVPEPSTAGVILMSAFAGGWVLVRRRR
jgi:hypothetical protein